MFIFIIIATIVTLFVPFSFIGKLIFFVAFAFSMFIFGCVYAAFANDELEATY